MTDAALVAEIEETYRSGYRRFLRVAVAILRDDQLAHDAVQEGFARALKQRATYRAEAPLAGWVWRIVMNAALEIRRERPLNIEVDPGDSAALPFNGHGEDAAGIRRWIAALPERQRLAIYLRYYADLDYRGIAEALGIEIGTVSATLAGAHQALRRTLEEVSRCSN